MSFTRVVTIAALALLTTSALAPSVAASSQPNCLQVFPWSLLCQTGLDRVVCPLGICPGGSFPPIECAQVLPLSELCGGDVRGFVCYKVDCEGIPDPDPVACVPSIGSRPEVCIGP